MTDQAWTITDPRFECDAFKPEHAIWPWAGHRNFAYDLVRWLKPKRIVELGVHWGTSFFAFAQAIKDAQLDTELVGVDTFVGDEQAGTYGSEVFDSVQQIVRQRFASQRITLHKSTFRDARASVEIGSVDLLHIDGLHTYEAVKDDYETWVGKLVPAGIVLFHDVSASSGYGSATFWSELRAQYPGFEFEHSWGLGVLFPRGDRLLTLLQRQNILERARYYTYKATSEHQARALIDMERMLKERLDGIRSQTEIIADRDAWIAKLKQEIKAASELAEQRLSAINTQSAIVRDRDAWIESLRRDLAAAKTLAEERLAAIRNQTALIAQRDAMASTLKADLDAAAELARQRYDVMQEQTRWLQERAQRIDRLQLEAKTSSEAIASLTAQRDALQSKSEQLRAELRQAEAALQQATTELDSVRAEATERRAQTVALADAVEQLGLDLELLRVRLVHLESVAGPLARTDRPGVARPVDTKPGQLSAQRVTPQPGTPLAPGPTRQPPQSQTGANHSSIVVRLAPADTNPTILAASSNPTAS